MSEPGVERGPAAPGEGERVRFCLACGAVLAFADTTCSACGHVESAHPDSPGEPVLPCPACLQFMPAGWLFCPACGVEVSRVGHAVEAAPAFTEEPGGSIAALSVTLALLAPLLVLLALGRLFLQAFPALHA